MGDGRFNTARALWAIRDDRTLSACEQRVLVMLVAFANDGGTAFPSVRRIAEAARTSRSGVKRALKAIEAGKGPISIAVTRGRQTEVGDSDCHTYTLRLREGWAHTDPTPDQPDPTVGPGRPHGWAHTDPGGGPTGAPEEDLKKRILEEDTEEAFELWASTLWSRLHKAQPKKTAKRLSHIRARLAEGYTKAQLAEVFRKVAQSEFHTKGGYIEPETILRNAEKVDGWLARKMETGRGSPVQPNHGAFDHTRFEQ